MGNYTEYTHHNSRSEGMKTVKYTLKTGNMEELEQSEEWKKFDELLRKYLLKEQEEQELIEKSEKEEKERKFEEINFIWKEAEKAAPKRVRELHRKLKARYGNGFPFSMRYPLLSKILKRILLTAITAGCCVPAAIAGVIVGTHILMR